MKRLTEVLKSIMILLLVCSLLLLAIMAMPMETVRSSPRLSKLLQPLAPLLGLPEAEFAYVEAAQPIRDAAQPVLISVRNSLGRSTAMWDFDRLDADFEALGSALGQALDTAGSFTLVSDQQVHGALSGTGVYFRYGGHLPMGLAASWLQADLQAQVPASDGCVLAVEGDAVNLYLTGEHCYVSPTGLDPAQLTTLLENGRPDGSLFGFETQLEVAPMSPVPAEAPVLPGGSAVNCCTARFLNETATALGFNPYSDNRYTDSAGTVHFSESNCTLQVSADGKIRLTSAAEARFRAADSSDAALSETARQLLEQIMGDELGSARLYLTGLTRQDNITVCTFDYFFSGILVAVGDCAASVTFRDAELTELTVLARRFTAADRQHHLLPAAQAAAALPRGAALMPVYRIGTGGELEVGWKK